MPEKMKDPIYIKHPNPAKNITQAECLASLTDPDLITDTIYIFNSGNASYHYYNRPQSELTAELHAMWLEGLEEPMKSSFTKSGFEKNRGVLSFIRFANEMADVGLDKYVMKMLIEEHRQRWQNDI